MIQVKDVSFRYPGTDADTVAGLDFAVPKGEIFGFLGPSGAGKSTSVKMLIGILRDYRGSLQVRGTEVRHAPGSFYEKIGVSFELPNLFSKLTATENLEYFRRLYSRKGYTPAEMLARVGLADAANVRVSNFSKGMKMRLNFCRAVINKPELLFLDEPTSGLDPGYASIIKDEIVRARNEGATIFLTTHNMQVAEELCDRVAFLVDGKIHRIDSPRNLRLEGSVPAVRVEWRRPDGSLAEDRFSLNGIADNADFLKLLRSGNAETIHTTEPSLEEIFLRETGRHLT